MRIYLSQDIRNDKGFQVFPRSERGQKWEDFKFAGDHVFCDKGFFYVDIGPQGPVSDDLTKYIKKVSLQQHFDPIPRRGLGIYKRNSAVAELDIEEYDRRHRYEVRIVGDVVEDVRDLYLQIRAGTILPTESWEVSQISEATKPSKETSKSKEKSPLVATTKEGRKSFLGRFRGILRT